MTTYFVLFRIFKLENLHITKFCRTFAAQRLQNEPLFLYRGYSTRTRIMKASDPRKKPRKNNAPKTPEAAARKRAHQFGQPGGNKPGTQATAVAQRDFYRWVECEATEAELRAYMEDESKPYIRRKFIQSMVKAAKVEDHFALTNQVHGAPKQPIEIQDLPKIECKVFGDD